MIIRLFKNFNKRINSTKRPLLDSGLVMECYLKEDTSLENPIFIIDRLAIGDETSQENWLDGYNYMYSNNHYYFIDDIIFRSDFHIEVHCHQDILATYRTDIGNLVTLIERSSSEADIMLPDTMIIQRGDIIRTSSTNTNVLGSGESYLVRAMFNGGLKGYVLSEAQMQALASYIVERPDIQGMLDTGGAGVGDFLMGLSTALSGNQAQTTAKIETATAILNYNPADYIKSVMYFPMSLPGSNVPVQIGPVNQIAVQVYPMLSGNGSSNTYSLSIPSGYYSDFRDYDASYTKASIYLPGVGSLSLDVSALRNGLSAKVDVDYISGGILYKIISGNAIILSAGGQIGVPVQYGGTTPNYAGGLAESLRSSQAYTNTFAQAGKNLVTGNYMEAGASLMNLINEPTNHMYNMGAIKASPTQSLIGGIGNASAVRYNKNIVISIEQVNSSENANNVYGRPLYKTRKISDIPGFVKCVNASINVDGFMSDKVTLNSYLNGGFYYE